MNAQNARTTKRPAPKGKRRLLTRKRILLTLLALFLAGVATVAVAWVAIGIPTPNQLAEAQASIVYYSDGKTEMDRITQVDGNRESVPLSKVPVHVQHALLAAEDRSFYQNKGVSPTGIGRALVAAVKGGPTQGGSTITQQYVKNYFLTQDQTLTRKGKELIISLKIDQQKSKSEILADYLNTIYYGRGAYGIQTASKAYFDKDVSKLTVSEGALLASVIRGPGFYDPSLGAQQKKNAQARVTYVLDGMQAEGWLTPAQRAKAKFPQVISPKAKKTKGGSIGYITADVQQELRTQAQADRRRARPRWPADHHHDQQAGAGRRREGRPGQHADRPGHLHPARGPGRGRAGQRRRRRDVRRQGLHQGPAQLRHRRDDAGRVDVQAVRR